MRKLAFVVLAPGVAALTLPTAQGGDAGYKPKRINKMIELLEAGQTVYDISVQDAGYEEGKKLAQDRMTI